MKWYFLLLCYVLLLCFLILERDTLLLLCEKKRLRAVRDALRTYVYTTHPFLSGALERALFIMCDILKRVLFFIMIFDLLNIMHCSCTSTHLHPLCCYFLHITRLFVYSNLISISRFPGNSRDCGENTLSWCQSGKNPLKSGKKT